MHGICAQRNLSNGVRLTISHSNVLLLLYYTHTLVHIIAYLLILIQY